MFWVHLIIVVKSKMKFTSRLRVLKGQDNLQRWHASLCEMCWACGGSSPEFLRLIPDRGQGQLIEIVGELKVAGILSAASDYCSAEIRTGTEQVGDWKNQDIWIIISSLTNFVCSKLSLKDIVSQNAKT